MRHARWMGFWMLLGASFVAAGCKSEPTFVITFAPQDLRGADTGGVGAARADLATARIDALPAPTADDREAEEKGKPDKDGKDACKKDADCVLVNEECCGCGAGGSQLAIAKGRKKTYEARLGARCAAVSCMQMISTHASCAKVAGCVSGTCQLVEPKKAK